jgi:hypothetical protein
MDSDEVKSGVQSLRRPRLQFSVLALLTLMTLVYLVLFWLTRPRPVKVVALLVVNSRPLDGSDGNGDLTHFEAIRQVELTRLKSAALFQTAMSVTTVAKLPLIMETSDPATWLRNNVSVKFEQNSEILSVTLSVLSNRSADAQLLLDAFVRAYLQDAAVAEQQQRQLAMQKLQTTYAATSAEVKTLSEHIAKLRAERGSQDPEAKLLQIEADRKVEHAGVLKARSASLPTVQPRIKLIQPAIATGN